MNAGPQSADLEAAQAAVVAARKNVESAARQFGDGAIEVSIAREVRAAAQRRLDELDGALAARAIDPIATRLWGERWASSFAHFMGINPRTAQRIFSAAKSGTGHLAAIRQAPEFFDRIAALAADARELWPPK